VNTPAPVLSEPGVVWRLTLNRPDARNAVSAAMVEELAGALGRAAADPGCRVVVLAGAGKDFCAGADVGELAVARNSEGLVAYGATFASVLRAIEDQPQPVIAQVHGAALGAGCQILVACDLAAATEDARIGIPSARLGLLIGYENVERLTLAIGPKRATEMLVAGRTLTGMEAAEWGLVNDAIPREALGERVMEMAEGIAALAPLSVKGSKRGIRAVMRSLMMDRATGGHLAADFDVMAAAAFASEDLAEGLAAFRERRSPRFGGK
jgi:enoyl-CoA hydratase/carnithine racemase